jgi:hypothetical protein
MNYQQFSSPAKNRVGTLLRGSLDVFMLVLILSALFVIEPVNKALVRDVIKQNATDQQLSNFANEIVIQSLLCRRFEKDILLNLHDQQTRSVYQTQWERAMADLEQAITGFQVTAVKQSDREQATAWKSASEEYQNAVRQLLQAIDNGTITQPTEANRLLTSEKGAIRNLTDTATAIAREKDTAVEASSSAISSSFTMSARIITLLILIGAIVWMTIRQASQSRAVVR